MLLVRCVQMNAPARVNEDRVQEKSVVGSVCRLWEQHYISGKDNNAEVRCTFSAAAAVIAALRDGTVASELVAPCHIHPS